MCNNYTKRNRLKGSIYDPNKISVVWLLKNGTKNKA